VVQGEFLNTSTSTGHRGFRRLKIFLIAVILILSVPIIGIMQKLSLDRAARELSLAVTESVLAGNDPSLLLQSGSREFASSTSEEYLRNYINHLRRLGRLELLESVSGSTNVPLLPFLGDAFTASYVIITRSENSNATATVDLQYTEGQWQVSAFRVNSPLTDE